MAKRCELCGKGPLSGKVYSRRGKAKKQGGVGRRILGSSLRRFLPNLQPARVWVDGHIKRIRVCTKCIKKGRITRVTSRKPATALSST